MTNLLSGVNLFSDCYKELEMRDFTPEEAKDEIEVLKIIIKFLSNRGFAWDMFLRPFRIMYYKHQLKKLKAIVGDKA